MKRRSLLEWTAWAYAVTFVVVVAVGYVPGTTNEEGELFGLFTIDPIDDALHLASGVWAAFAAWRSTAARVFFFRWFGTIYFLDGAIGAVVGKGFLDGALFRDVPAIEGALTRVAANVPHLALGGFAMLVGFAFAQKWASEE